MTLRQGARAIAVWAEKVIPVIVRDVIGLAGLGLIGYGAWLIYQPAGYIVAGIVFVLFAYLSARISTGANG